MSAKLSGNAMFFNFHESEIVVIVSYIQRIGCQPEKTTLRGGRSRTWSAEQGKQNKRKSLAAYPPLCSFGESKIKLRDASTCLGATQVSVRLASVQGFLRLVTSANMCRFAKFYASVCDNNFPSHSLVAPLFTKAKSKSWVRFGSIPVWAIFICLELHGFVLYGYHK